MMQGIIASIIAAILIGVVTTVYHVCADRQIKITDPRPGETLTDPEPLGGVWAFPVTGTLKRLPEGNEIWLLIEDESNRQLYPQGFFNVLYDHQQEKWWGKICAPADGKRNIKIIAVVAPPTSQDFFRYYETVGIKRGYEFEALKQVPAECRNRVSVQAFLPKLLPGN